MNREKFRIRILQVFLLITSTYVHASEIQFEKGTFNDALKQAEIANKIIFIDAYTTWCGPCKWMSSTIFTKDEVAEFYNKNFICYKLDMEKGEGINFAKKYEIKAYPTFLFINSSGELIHQACGKMEAADFIKLGNNALDPEMQLYSLKRKFDEGNRAFDFLRNYASALYAANSKNDEIVQLLLEAPQEAELFTEKDFEMLSSSAQVGSSAFEFIVTHREKYEGLMDKSIISDFITEAFLAEATAAAKQNSVDKLKIATLSIDKYGIENKEELIANMSWHYAKVTKVQMFEEAQNYIENFKMKDPEELNNVAWDIFMNYKNPPQLKVAENWARTSVELNPNYMNTDTYAAILHKLGKNREALKYANLSIQMAQKQEQDSKDTEKLRNEIETQLAKSKTK